MELLDIRHKPLVDRYLRLHPHELSLFCFANIFIWKSLFKIYYKIINNNLCIFFQNSIGIFMSLPPLGERINPDTINAAFDVMDKINKDQRISRIENIGEQELKFYIDTGLEIKPQEREYIYKGKVMAQPSGDKFKAKRAACNYLLKHYRYEFKDFSPAFVAEALRLYKTWMQQRKAKSSDPIYQGMLEDGLSVNQAALENYHGLGLRGKAVFINDKIAAYSFGCGLNNNTFCIISEICNLKVKGLAQFIFREFARDLKDYEFINVMGDSGLANLRRVKLSYKPFKEINSYVGYRYAA